LKDFDVRGDIMLRKKNIAIVTSFSIIISLFFAANINGKPADVKKIPNGKKFSCANCHSEKPYKASALTPFGIDFKANSKEWNPDLAKKDSDGDGISNGRELCDADGTWKKGDDDKPGNVTNPGDPSSK
jgi:hypothetical protein